MAKKSAPVKSSFKPLHNGLLCSIMLIKVAIVFYIWGFFVGEKPLLEVATSEETKRCKKVGKPASCRVLTL